MSRSQQEPPNWSTYREAIRVIFYPPFLRKTGGTALLIGLLLFFINHLDEVLRGQATAGTWIKGALTCLVPFSVANWGVIVATRLPQDSRTEALHSVLPDQKQAD